MVLNRSWTNIASDLLSIGSPAAMDHLHSEPASSWYKVRGRQHDLNATLLRSRTNYNKTRGPVHEIQAHVVWGRSMSTACTLSNLGHLKGYPTAHLGLIQGGFVLNEQSDIPLTIQDCCIPTAHLLAFLVAPNCFCLSA